MPKHDLTITAEKEMPAYKSYKHGVIITTQKEYQKEKADMLSRIKEQKKKNKNIGVYTGESRETSRGYEQGQDWLSLESRTDKAEQSGNKELSDRLKARYRALGMDTKSVKSNVMREEFSRMQEENTYDKTYRIKRHKAEAQKTGELPHVRKKRQAREKQIREGFKSYQIPVL